jgi:hypothetical protein
MNTAEILDRKRSRLYFIHIKWVENQRLKMTVENNRDFETPAQRALLYKRWANVCANLGYHYFAQKWHDLRVSLITDYADAKRSGEV